MYAREIMDTRYKTLHPDETIATAVKTFQTASQALGKAIFGMMVIDDRDRLVGMLSMYDILVFVQPKHAGIWGEMADIDPARLFDSQLERVKKIFVKDVMTTDVLTLSPDVHVINILDVMIKKHVRRIPVVEDDRVVGVLYRSDVFYHLLKRFTV
jgi:CBS domain-containing protein